MELNATMDEFDARHRHFRETWAVTRFVDGELDLDANHGFGQHHLGVFVTLPVLLILLALDLLGRSLERVIPTTCGAMRKRTRFLSNLATYSPTCGGVKESPSPFVYTAKPKEPLTSANKTPGVQNVRTDLLLFVVR